MPWIAGLHLVWSLESAIQFNLRGGLLFFRLNSRQFVLISRSFTASLFRVPPCLCITKLGFLLFSRKFSSRFEFRLSVLISLICVISGEVLVFQRAQRI